MTTGGAPPSHGPLHPPSTTATTTTTYGEDDVIELDQIMAALYTRYPPILYVYLLSDHPKTYYYYLLWYPS